MFRARGHALLRLLSSIKKWGITPPVSLPKPARGMVFQHIVHHPSHAVFVARLKRIHTAVTRNAHWCTPRFGSPGSCAVRIGPAQATEPSKSVPSRVRLSTMFAPLFATSAFDEANKVGHEAVRIFGLK